MKMNRCAGALLLAGTMLGTLASAALPFESGPGMQFGPEPRQVSAYPPLRDWPVDSAAFIKSIAARAGGPKAAEDVVSVYRPVSPCRLFDTRGFPAALAIAGPFAPNSTTNINSAGACGIPMGLPVVGLSITITVQNLTPGSGGYIATQQQGAPVNAINAVLAGEWTSTTANVPIPNRSGNFSVYLSTAQAHVIVDVNGYYQDLGNLDTGTQQFDVLGNTVGDVFSVANANATGTAIAASSGTGVALRASAGTTGTAVLVGTGAFRVSGAGVGSTTSFATIHEVDTSATYPTGTICSGFPAYSVFDHPLANGDPNALLIITPRSNLGVGAFNGVVAAYYSPGPGCGVVQSSAKWLIRRMDGTALPNGAQFSILIIKQGP